MFLFELFETQTTKNNFINITPNTLRTYTPLINQYKKMYDIQDDIDFAYDASSHQLKAITDKANPFISDLKIRTSPEYMNRSRLSEDEPVVSLDPAVDTLVDQWIAKLSAQTPTPTARSVSSTIASVLHLKAKISYNSALTVVVQKLRDLGTDILEDELNETIDYQKSYRSAIARASVAKSEAEKIHWRKLADSYKMIATKQQQRLKEHYLDR
jgi:hypothetical protein